MRKSALVRFNLLDPLYDETYFLKLNLRIVKALSRISYHKSVVKMFKELSAMKFQYPILKIFLGIFSRIKLEVKRYML